MISFMKESLSSVLKQRWILHLIGVLLYVEQQVKCFLPLQVFTLSWKRFFTPSSSHRYYYDFYHHHHHYYYNTPFIR